MRFAPRLSLIEKKMFISRFLTKFIATECCLFYRGVEIIIYLR